ncbi:unnamed protein product [Rotaria magnacalcarata]|nr:unnamed protein product [Rotaria magnacalcarata]CAF2204596.1 unnamed protein product [Rotaria magnacalcarata]
MASVIKANVRRFINEKNNCVTNSDFVNGAKSTRYTTVMACRLPSSSAKKKTKWQGIQSFNNIQYEFASNELHSCSETSELEINVTVWKAFRIGRGQLFQWSKLNTSTNSITPVQVSARYDNVQWQTDSVKKGQVIEDEMIDTNSSNDETSNLNPGNDISMNKNSMDADDAGLIFQSSSIFVTFDCPEPHCVMQFPREDRLRAHMLLGFYKILLPTFRLLDKAMLMYKEGLESDHYKQVPITCTVATNSTSHTKPKKNFTQRSYLEDKYNEGEKSGAKWDPAKVAEDMQVIQSDGRFIFEPDQFLTTSQTKSYFSRLTRERRKHGNLTQNIMSTSTTTTSSDDEAQEEEEEEEEEDVNDLIQH